MKAHSPIRFVTLLLLLVTLNVNAQSISVVGQQNTCLNSSELYGVSSGSVVSWNVTGGNNFVTLGQTVQVLWKHIGTYTVSAVVYAPGGNITYTLTVTVNTLPQPEIIPLNSNLCTSPYGDSRVKGRGGQAGDNPDYSSPSAPQSPTCLSVCDSGWYKFAVAGHAGSSYTWATSTNAQVVPLNINGDSVKVRWTLVGYTALTVTETDANGCKGISETCIQVIKKPTACFTSAPAADVNGDIHVCLNSSLSLNSNCSAAPYGSNIVSRRWLFGDNTAEQSGPYVNHTYSQVGQHTLMLIVETNCGCEDTFKYNVIVDASPGPDIYCVNSVCHDSVSVFRTSEACSSLQWTATGGSIVGSSTDNNVTIVWGSGNTGYGSVSLLSSCSGSCPFPTVVYVPILPDSAVIMGDSIVCNQALETYSVPFVPSTVYTWYICTGPPNSLSCSVVPNANANEFSYTWFTTTTTLPEQKFTLKVAYTNPFLGCSGISLLPITIASPFQVLGDTIICQGSSNTWKARTAANASVNCNWELYSFNTNTTTVVQTNDPDVTLSGLAVGNYTLYATSANVYWCGNPVAVNIRVVESPATPTAAVIGPDTVCINSLANYFTTSAPAGYYIEWEASPATPAGGNGESFSTVWGSGLPGELKVRYVTIGDPSCPSAWATKTIRAMPLDLPDITGAASSCGDDTARYKIDTEAESFNWTIDPAEAGSVMDGRYGNEAIIQWNHYTGSTNTTATVTVTVIKCGTTVVRNFTVTIHPAPVPSLTAATAPYCVGKDITFTATPASSTSPNPVYNWQFGSSTTTSTSTASTTYAFGSEGSFPVKVTIQNPDGCRNPVSAVVVVDVLPGPVAILSTGTATNHCGDAPGWSNVLQVTLQNMGSTTFTYQLYSGTTPVGSPGSSSSFTVTATGSYKVKVTNSSGCSEFTNVIDITDNCGGGCSPVGSVSLSVTSNVCGVVTVSASTTSATFTNFYFYDDFSGSNSATTSPATHTFTKAGQYRITAFANSTDANGDPCTVSADIWVTINYVPDFTVQFACSGSTMQTHLIDLSTYVTGHAIDAWHWYLNSTIISPDPGQNPTLNLTAGSSYDVVLVISHSSEPACTTSVKNITVPVPAQASYTSADGVCETDAVNFTSTSTVAADIISYLWNYGDMTYSTLQNSSKVFSCTPGMGGVSCSKHVTLTVTDKYGCVAVSSEPDEIVYDDKLTGGLEDITPASLVLCSGNNATISVSKDISATINGAPYDYVWSDGFTGSSASFPISRVVTTSSSYSVTITNQYGCRVLKGPADVFFEDVAAVLRGDTIFCEDEKMNLSVFKGQGYTYQWFRADMPGGSMTPYSEPGPPYLVDSKMSGLFDMDSFMAVVTSPSGCHDTVGPVVVHMFEPVSSHINAVISPNTLCGTDVPITITLSSDANSTFIWSNGVYGNTVVLSAPGNYGFQAIDTNGCRGDMVEFPVIKGPDFGQMITGCYVRCIGADNTLHAPVAYSPHIYSYQWLLNDTAVVSTLANYNPQVEGEYRVVISDSYSGYICTDTSNAVILTLEPCPDTYCIPEGLDTSCTGCHYDSLTNTRVIEFMVSFYYTPAGTVPYSLYCSTAQINAYENIVTIGGVTQSIMHNVQHGMNNIHLEIWDTLPHQSTHEVVLIIGSCHIPITIQTPANCK